MKNGRPRAVLAVTPDEIAQLQRLSDLHQWTLRLHGLSFGRRQHQRTSVVPFARCPPFNS